MHGQAWQTGWQTWPQYKPTIVSLPGMDLDADAPRHEFIFLCALQRSEALFVAFYVDRALYAHKRVKAL